MSDPQGKLQALSEEFTKLQQELQTTISSRQKLDAQKAENEGVESEFDKLKDDETIYKLVGPVLLKQDKTEAESTVKGRLDFINKEIVRLETQIKDIQDKLEKIKGDILRIQAGGQAGVASGGGGKQAVKA